MAKQNGRIKLISLIVMLAMLFAGIIATWTVYGKDIEITAKAVADLEIEGCKPARVHTTEIAVINTKLDTIQRTQTEKFKEILKRLPE